MVLLGLVDRSSLSCSCISLTPTVQSDLKSHFHDLLSLSSKFSFISFTTSRSSLWVKSTASTGLWEFQPFTSLTFIFDPPSDCWGTKWHLGEYAWDWDYNQPSLPSACDRGLAESAHPHFPRRLTSNLDFSRSEQVIPHQVWHLSVQVPWDTLQDWIIILFIIQKLHVTQHWNVDYCIISNWLLAARINSR